MRGAESNQNEEGKATMRVVIEGTFMERSLNDFARACLALIEEEQAQLAPNNALIAVLCDAVRLTREMAYMNDIGVWPARGFSPEGKSP